MNTNNIKIGDTVYFTGETNPDLTKGEPLEVIAVGIDFGGTEACYCLRVARSLLFNPTLYAATKFLTATPPVPKSGNTPKGCSFRDNFNF